jgi:hypothetical protein
MDIKFLKKCKKKYLKSGNKNLKTLKKNLILDNYFFYRIVLFLSIHNNNINSNIIL